MLDCGKSQHQLVEGMDEVEMRLFSWGTEENKKNIHMYLPKNKQKNSTTVANVRNTCTDILALHQWIKAHE